MLLKEVRRIREKILEHVFGELYLTLVSLISLWHNQAKNLLRERVSMKQAELAISNISKRSGNMKMKK